MDALNRHVGPKETSVRRHLSVVLSSKKDSRLQFNRDLIVIMMNKIGNPSHESCRIFIQTIKRSMIQLYFLLIELSETNLTIQLEYQNQSIRL